jgi:RNA polymerase sigma-70 factor (ECF subfamily)
VLKIINSLDAIDVDNPFTTKSFVYSITKNKAIDYLRQKNRYEVVDIEDIEYSLEDNLLPPLESLLNKDIYERLIGYILSLDDIYKNVCQLKYINEMTEAEIAKVLDLSPKAVNSRIFRGRQILKKMIIEGDKNGQ